MRMVRILSVALLMGLAAVSTAGAQDQNKVGITMGYPASIGVVWPVTDTVAIRPELSFSGASSDSAASSFESESDGWAFGTGVSALFYLRKYDNLRTYVVPRFTYSRATTTVTSSSFTNSETTTTTSNTGLAGSFGAQYSLGDKFAVFGEVGFGFNHSWGTSSTTTAKASSNTWGSRTGVGIIFFP